MPVPTDVPGLDPLPQRSLTCTQSCRDLWLRPAPSVVAPLYLSLWWGTLPKACSGGDGWFRPAPAEIAGWGTREFLPLLMLRLKGDPVLRPLPQPEWNSCLLLPYILLFD